MKTVQKFCSVTSICKEAFANWKKLTSITASGSVGTLGVNLFEQCGELSEITVAEEGENLKTINSVLLDKEMTRFWYLIKKNKS